MRIYTLLILIMFGKSVG